MKQLNDLENLKNVLLMEYVSNIAQQNEKLAEENKTLLDALKASDKKNESLKEIENLKAENSLLKNELQANEKLFIQAKLDLDKKQESIDSLEERIERIKSRGL